MTVWIGDPQHMAEGAVLYSSFNLLFGSMKWERVTLGEILLIFCDNTQIPAVARGWIRGYEPTVFNGSAGVTIRSTPLAEPGTCRYPEDRDQKNQT